MTFKSFESLTKGSAIELDKVLSQVKFNEDGLISAIAQDHKTKEVLMLAWMNIHSLKETIETKQVCYWSRSRNCYWRKGESSGHRQTLKSLSFDCDGDCILMQVHQKGAACHTNRTSCFYLEINENAQGEAQVIINSDADQI
ncbi:phosphoribosyl-AMP cyclohydrolase [Marinicellulosiphila megalodicopiae]|uniref:phosphoribosyl-AMP cyclohydrolase n=1 Tax=Marinicellulosiphila megalodicopiae TaxID=2724896 RepID=UPI003BAE8F96